MSQQEVLQNPEFSSGPITLNEDELKVKWYYFPAGTKTIPLNEIVSARKMEWKRPRIITTKRWGMAVSYYWWPLDWKRYQRENFVEVNTGDRLKVGLSCEDTNGLAAALAKKLPKGVWDDNIGEL